MTKICFVVQRYGEQIVGGSETYCRTIAERLLPYYDVEILTSKALDYSTWQNCIAKDMEIINGITVRRFPVERERVVPYPSQDEFKKIVGFEKGLEFVCNQGPYCPSLLEFVSDHKDDYDAFVLMTYLYYPTVLSSGIVGDKSILIPTAHDEEPIYLDVFQRLFSNVAAWYYLTQEEKDFVERLFPSTGKILGTGLGGVGVDLPEGIDSQRFREQYGLGDSRYLIYAGRISPAKGCIELFRYFIGYRQRNQDDIKLVLIGQCDDGFVVPGHPDIISAGFVDEKTKFDAISGAEVLIQPSHFESLSIVVLEAMAVGTPVLVSGKCEVTKGHCIKSNAGLYYESYYEFETAVNILIKRDELCQSAAENAKTYIQVNYQWERIINELRQMIDSVAERKNVAELPSSQIL